MQKVYTAQTLLAITHIKNLLEAARIPVELRNEFSAGGMGELSFIDTCPELWVPYEDALQAKQIIQNAENSEDQQQGQEWRCECGELNGPAFASCWACNKDRPS